MLWSSEASFFEHITRTQCAFSIAVLTLVFIIVVIIYNIFLHPLARFPGPIHYRASILPWAYETFRGTLTFTVLGPHERYGPVVRISPSGLCFSDPLAWRDIYGTTAGQENPKYHGVYGGLSSHMAESILAARPEKHNVMRGILAEGFSNRVIRGQERLIMGHVDVMMQQLQNIYRQENYEVNGNMGREFNAKGVVIDVNEWFYWITSDIISDLPLGESFHCLETLQTHPYLRFLSIVPEWLLKSVVLCHLGMGTIIEIVALTFASKLSQMLEGMKERLEKRIESTDKRGDHTELMLAAKEAGQLTFEQVLGTANFLILAGSETTSITLTAFIYFMVTNSIHLTGVADEILSAFKSEDEINLSRAEELQYLNACLKKTLRAYPAIAGGPPRVVARGGRAIAGNYTPQDTIVSVHGYAATHLCEHFHEPFEFHPERFLGGEKHEGDILAASQPFLVGPRNCLGKNLSFAEMRLIVSKLLWNFDIELIPESKGWMVDWKIYIVWKHKPLMVGLKLRNHDV